MVIIVVVVAVVVIVIVVVEVVVIVYKNNEETQEWKWNRLQTKLEHVTITKEQYTWTKAQHPSKTGQLIRKCHKLLQNLF